MVQCGRAYSTGRKCTGAFPTVNHSYLDEFSLRYVYFPWLEPVKGRTGQSWKKRVLRVLQNPPFLDSPPNLSCFPPNSYQILPNFTNFYQSLPTFTKFTKFYQIFTTFHQSLPHFYQVSDLRSLSQFQIVVIYMYFRQICIPKKSGLTKKLLFPTLVLEGIPQEQSF